MAFSIRKQITDAVIALLNGDVTTPRPSGLSGVILTKNRVLPIGRDEVEKGMWSVYLIHEAPMPVGNPRRPVVMDRKLTIEVRIIVKGDDDTADPHAQWIVQRLGLADRMVSGGIQITLGISEGEWLFEPLEGTEGKVLVTSSRWVVEYKTLPADITKVS